MECVAGWPLQKTQNPVALVVMGFAEQVIRRLVSLAELRAYEHAAAELQSLQMLLDGGKILVAELRRQHRKQSRNAVRREISSVTIGNSAQPPELAYQHL
jgi:hypothetical protein